MLVRSLYDLIGSALENHFSPFNCNLRQHDEGEWDKDNWKGIRKGLRELLKWSHDNVDEQKIVGQMRGYVKFARKMQKRLAESVSPDSYSVDEVVKQFRERLIKLAQSG